MTFPITQKPDNPAPISLSELEDEASERFKSRPKRPPKLADPLWKESRDQAGMGWLDQPRLLDQDGRFVDSPGVPPIEAFRLPVIQGEKVRACDDLTASLTNRARLAHSPIPLPTWEHVDRIASALDLPRMPLALGKADESDAYKKQPLCPVDVRLGSIILGFPDRKRYGFSPALRSSDLPPQSPTIAHFPLIGVTFCPHFGIPMVGFFGDFGFVIFDNVMDQALATFVELRRLLGARLSPKKGSSGTTNAFL